MMHWRQLLAGLGVVAFAVSGVQGQVTDSNDPQVKAMRERLHDQLVAQGQLEGGVVVNNGGFIVLNPQVLNQPQISGFTGEVILPVVNEGFANDLDAPGPLRPLVSALKSADYGEREDASRAMLRLPPARLSEVVEALAHETDAEAIERLTQIAAHLYLKPRTLLKTRASVFGVWHQQPNLSLLGMKFRMDPVKLASGAEAGEELTMTAMVTEIQVGFPTLQTLRNGDRIVAMGGVGFPPDLPLNDSTYFRARVAALWPGSVVRMTVLREGKLIELGVQVAGLPLNGAVNPEDMIALRATALASFLQSLKTGDKSQAMISPTDVPRPGPVIMMQDTRWGSDELVVPIPDAGPNVRH